jgi:hypothetical protein
MGDALITVDTTRAKAVILSAMPATADRDRILRGLGAAAVATWKKLAQQELRSTSRDYIAGISAPVITKGEKVEVVLEGRVPNMVEQGWNGGDMRQWLLTGPKVKQGVNGPYAVIPFRHGSPGTGGRNVGNGMPGPIYDVARKLAPTISRPGQAISGQGGRTTIWGARLHPGMPMKSEARAILERTEKPWHATSIYMGMVRKAQPTRGGRYQTSGFQTFRTISMHTREPGKHWVHPGIKARGLAKKVEEQMVALAHQIVGIATGTGGRR